MNAWAQRIQQARDARIAAMAAEEQIVRDAAADGQTPTDLAAAYGTKGRQRIYAILRANPAAPQPPAMPPTVYLRGAGCKQPTWDRVEPAMWARGWDTVHDRTTAWHRARGGLVVVLCDFSAGMGSGYDKPVVQVGKVRARYGTDAVGGAQELELPFVNGGYRHRPATGHALDVDALARMVAEVLEHD